jgi:hypothetical protein
MAIFSHIEHISHKYLMKVKFAHKLPYFHTLSIFHTSIQWKSNFTQMVISSHIEYILHHIIKYFWTIKYTTLAPFSLLISLIMSWLYHANYSPLLHSPCLIIIICIRYISIARSQSRRCKGASLWGVGGPQASSFKEY